MRVLMKTFRGYKIWLRYGYPSIWKDSKNVLIHRLLAEEVLGRTLTSNEIVHHIDEDRTNFTRSNLLICTRGYHKELHTRMKLQKLGVDWRTHKICGKCKEPKFLDKFYACKGRFNGVKEWCKVCFEANRRPGKEVRHQSVNRRRHFKIPLRLCRTGDNV